MVTDDAGEACACAEPAAIAAASRALDASKLFLNFIS
jgi:hypothetical protein